MEQLPFPSASFDVVTCAGGLSYGDHQLVMAEIMRVLRPEGMLICIDSLNNNPIYRLNRWIHFLRDNRTKSTLKRMPDMKYIKELSAGFQKVRVDYFGAITFAMPFVARLMGESVAKTLSDRIDRWLRVKRAAFKFVFVGYSGINLDQGKSITSYESYAHYVRFPSYQGSLNYTIDNNVFTKAFAQHVALPYRCSLIRLSILSNIGNIDRRGAILLRFFALYNLFFGDVFVVTVHDENDLIVHRSTIVRRDFRRPHLPNGFEITQVWTDEAHRRKGIAAGVVKALIQALPDQQFHWCVRTNNLESIQLIEKIGFQMNRVYTSTHLFGVRFFK